ncbi:MAG TPA: peroxidase family protein, partial [Pirellulales bacterium]
MRKHIKLSVEQLECRVLFSISPASSPSPFSGAVSTTYSVNGTGNNLAHPTWGSAGVDLLRTAPSDYGDGLSTPAGADRPSARAISDAVSDQGGVEIPSDTSLSAMVYAWGQFIDHDIDLTPTGGTEEFDVAVPKGDPSFDPTGTGTATIPLTRSIFDPATGVTDPRQQVNVITAYLDGSMIYGSDSATALALRTLSGGQMKTSAGGLLPLNNSATLPNGPLPMANDAQIVPESQLFAAGDVRANENSELTSLQTLFVREHNYWADQIAKANPRLSDEQIYQQARSIVIAEIQSITYNEWLPAVLGRNAVDKYTGYDRTVNPGIANEFSTAAFRFGHSLLGDDVEFLDNRGLPVANAIPLSQAFFNPAVINDQGIAPILKYLASDPSSEVDTKVVDGVRNFLFGPPGAGGLDLASLNIQRGRDNGLADYNTVRESYGLPRVTSFAQITSDPKLQAQLASLYGTVDNIDLWVGALAEDHPPGASVGPTLQAIISDQFERLRDGDRLWFERTFSGGMLNQLENTTLTDIIERNTNLTNLQDNLFFFRASISGTVFADSNGNGRDDWNDRGLKGQTVELLDVVSGELVATTTTDGRGNYSFDVADGL